MELGQKPNTSVDRLGKQTSKERRGEDKQLL